MHKDSTNTVRNFRENFPVTKKNAVVTLAFSRSTRVIFDHCTFRVLRRLLNLAENAALSTTCKTGRIKGVPLYCVYVNLNKRKSSQAGSAVLRRIIDWSTVQDVKVYNCTRETLDYVATNAVKALHLTIHGGLYVPFLQPRGCGDEMIRLTRGLPHVQSFCCEFGASLCLKDIRALTSWKNLRKLNLSDTAISKTELVALSCCGMIEEASLKLSCHEDDEGCDGSGLLALATGCKSLHTLTLYLKHEMFQNMDVVHLHPGVFGACQKLNLSIKTGDDDFPRELDAFFAMFSAIEYLRLKIAVIENGHSVGQMVSQCPQLKELRLFIYESLVTDEDLESIRLPGLRLLHMYWCPSGAFGQHMYPYPRTDGLRALLTTHRNTLEILYLRGFCLTDKDMEVIAAGGTQLRKLTVVELDANGVTDKGLAAISIETLEEFIYVCDLSRVSFTSVGVASLARLAHDHHLRKVLFGQVSYHDYEMYIHSGDEDEDGDETISLPYECDHFQRTVLDAVTKSLETVSTTLTRFGLPFPSTCVVKCDRFYDDTYWNPKLLGE